MDMGIGGEAKMYGESNMETYITICEIYCMSQETQMGSLSTQRGGLGREMGGEVQKGGDICIPMADAC